MNRDNPYPSFVAFVEGVVLPRLLENPGHVRLDGREGRGNWEVAGRSSFGGNDWRAHEDNHYEPLLLAYWSARFRGKERTFERAETPKGVRLDLLPDLRDLRPTRHNYLYLDD